MVKDIESATKEIDRVVRVFSLLPPAPRPDIPQLFKQIHGGKRQAINRSPSNPSSAVGCSPTQMFSSRPATPLGPAFPPHRPPDPSPAPPLWIFQSPPIVFCMMARILFIDHMFGHWRFRTFMGPVVEVSFPRDIRSPMKMGKVGRELDLLPDVEVLD